MNEIRSQYPETAEVLFEIGMHYLECPVSQGESLEDACVAHGVDTEKVIKSINKIISNDVRCLR